MRWEDDFRSWLKAVEADSGKPVVLCGDLNVAHEEIDLKNPGTNRRNPGFTDEERAKMTALLDSGYCDTFRYYNPDKRDAYTWWSYIGKARERNTGWRIDYVIVSSSLIGIVSDAAIYGEYPGSDHCPVGISLDGCE
jgi:exodeoxyribonuclease-3